MKNLSVSLIGCGRIGFLLEEDPLRKKPCTHFGGALKAGITITSACDRSLERLEQFSKRANIPKKHCYLDHRELLNIEKPQLVIIATNTDSHGEIAVDAINSGAKVVVLEKPIAHSLEAAQRIIDAAAKNKAALIVNHERRFDARYKKVKEMIEKSEIGEIRTVNARILTGGYKGKSSILEGGGPLLHDGTHIADILRFFFGEIKLSRGKFERFSKNYGFEDFSVAWLTTENGIEIFLESGGKRRFFLFEIEIWGTDGKILIGNGYNKLYKSEPSRLYTGFRDLVEQPFPHYKENNCFHELYKNAKKLLKDSQSPNPSSAIDGYRALEIIHSIYLSSHKNKSISLPLKSKSVNLKKIFNLKD
ncbi:MAG TPA: Gfo/Idh/MocA family oxidoreductase [Spirochaetota bacterium]|jgi:predicted dehydrogenase|nr:Gfo/Idh/MocA family oxidoreductase [Spirochaetota bacterium]HOK92019.1 Gfo/Idh/MocA family oxidoreductase [Spirochaetota bacterium]HON16644.1 Gfo/Idh/MocA family oxidoreductase [Spirochaetota bacterium]HPP94631.1 Gfo/Idh/MocA family oxidoreductase [Spirochaetota bacterium]HRU65086.1 Gfo/Idh/MocA family oxidoreductase [Spirochaetota bacterium]